MVFLEQVYILEMDPNTGRMALGFSPPEENPPQQFREPRQQIKDPARARKADKSDRSEPRTQKATATLGTKSSKRKAKSLSGGMSALGSALALAGFKGRAQLDKEAEGESKATSSTGETLFASHGYHIILLPACRAKESGICASSNISLSTCHFFQIRK